MSPRILLFLVALAIIFLNITAVKLREKKLKRFETELRKAAVRKEGGFTVQEVAKILDLHVYDAKILTKKLVSKGKMDVRVKDDVPTYSFKARH